VSAAARVRLTKRGKLALVGLILAGLVGMPALAGTLYLRSIGLLGDSDPGRRVEVEIPKGASVAEIGRILADAGVIKSAFGFRIAAYLMGDVQIQAGRYGLFTGLSARDALAALSGGEPLGEDFVTVTFPEGSWLTDFARIVGRETHISRRAFMRVLESGEVRSRFQPGRVDTLEGLLFPSTYQVIGRDDALSLATRLVEEFDEQVGSLDRSQIQEMGYSVYDAVIVASMVEAESKVDADRAKIARVIYNRLEQGMPLGIDATVIYALGEHKEVLTASDLRVDSPYNTRLYPGLPPTPIGAPGLASLEAAFAPAKGDWLYYVLADCEGNHAFSVSYDDFLADKAAYQRLEC
jgi:UPF0755 protein